MSTLLRSEDLVVQVFFEYSIKAFRVLRRRQLLIDRHADKVDGVGHLKLKSCKACFVSFLFCFVLFWFITHLKVLSTCR